MRSKFFTKGWGGAVIYRSPHFEHLDEGDGKVEVDQVPKKERESHEEANGQYSDHPEAPRHHSFGLHHSYHLLPHQQPRVDELGEIGVMR